MLTLQSLPLAVIAWIAFVVLLAGFVQGALGFGFPFLATPLIALAVDTRTAIITILIPTIAVFVLNLVKGGPLGPVFKRFGLMPMYAALGAFAGTWLFVTAPDAPYPLLLAVSIFAYLGLDLFVRRDWPIVQRHERIFGPLAGVATGVFDGTANVGAPPVIVYFLALGVSPALMVPAMQICFLVGKTTQFGVLTLQGDVAVDQWLATLPLCALAIGTSIVGARVRERIDDTQFRLWVKRALAVIALVLIAQCACHEWGT